MTCLCEWLKAATAARENFPPRCGTCKREVSPDFAQMYMEGENLDKYERLWIEEVTHKGGNC
jgi:hypothetical protein